MFLPLPGPGTIKELAPLHILPNTLENAIYPPPTNYIVAFETRTSLLAIKTLNQETIVFLP